MSKITASIVADSKNEFGQRITTFLLVFPRIILSEFNTHRMFSRNSASSRAIPFKKMVQIIENDPFIPIAWQKDHKGMQGVEYHDPEYSTGLEDHWFEARDRCIEQAKILTAAGATKQLCNRLLEPFMWHTVLCTATTYENFFDLRSPNYRVQCMGGEVRYYKSKKDAIKYSGMDIDFDYSNTLEWLKINEGQAEIHMMALAEAMWDAYNESLPKLLKAGEWHIPFEDKIQLPPTIPIDDGLSLDEGVAMRKVKISTAMAARVSYTTVGDEKEVTQDKLIEIHNKMAEANPFHASPFEHCARAMSDKEFDLNINGEFPQRFDTLGHYSALEVRNKIGGWCKNYRGFIQYRKIIEDKNYG